MALKLLAPLRSWEERRALHAARRHADEEILATRLPPPRLAWRSEELVSAENRSDLGRSLTSVVHSADERLLPTATPLDRGAVRACRPELLELASRLFDLDTPVRPRGILLVDHLLTDSSGPLYGHGEPRRLRLAIRKAYAALTGTDDATL